MRTSVAILDTLAIASVVFGLVMLAWAVQEMQYEGERWGLVGVLVIGGPGLAIQGILLLATLAFLSRGLNRRQAVFPLVVAAVGLLANAAALACVFYEPTHHEMEFRDKSALYTSGLHAAVEAGDVGQAEAIARVSGSALFERDYSGYSPLVLASKRGDRAMVASLLALGANPNDHDFQDRTALSWAAEQGSIDIVRLLVESGADINEGDQDSKTPLAYARKSGHSQVVSLLQSKGGIPADTRKQVFEAVHFGRMDQLRSIIEAGFDVNWKYPSGTGLLHQAIRNGNREMVDYLLSKGADVNANSYFGTPLHSAANEGRVDMIQLLVSKGAKVDTVSDSGKTALDYAQEREHVEAVKALRALGATR